MLAEAAETKTTPVVVGRDPELALGLLADLKETREVLSAC